MKELKNKKTGKVLVKITGLRSGIRKSDQKNLQPQFRDFPL
jgi:hypothetical protein